MMDPLDRLALALGALGAAVVIAAVAVVDELVDRLRQR